MDTRHLFDDAQAVWLFGDRKVDLQELAAFQFAWKLWSDLMLSGKYHDYKSKLGVALMETSPIVAKFIKSLKLGSKLETHLTRAILTIQERLTLWIAYNHEQMLSGLGVGKIRKIILYTCHLKYVVFKANLDFDYKASARKMVEAKQFDKKVAFEIMCRFCMEDELKKLDPVEVRGLKKSFSFDQRPLAWYWIHYLTDDLPNGTSDFCLMLRGECCIPGFMLTTEDCENWSNIEYFYDRLCNEQDQALKACQVLRNINLNWYLNRFYWKMNSDQWRVVFETMPVDILFVFFRQYNELEKAFFLWKRVKDTLAEFEFVDLMDRILLEKKKTEWSYPTAMQLWTEADDRLKNFVLAKKNCSLVSANFFDTYFIRNFDKSLHFLYDLLSFAPPEYRKKILLLRGDVLFVSQNELDGKIDEIVQLCLPEPQDMAQFKVFLFKSTIIRLRCEQLLVDGKFGKLLDFFDTYFPCDDRPIVEYKKQLLENTAKKQCRRFIFDPTTWSELERFVDSAYSQDVSEAMAVKKRYIRSFELTLIEDCTEIDRLNQLREIVCRFLTADESVEMKTSLSIELKKQLNDLMSSYVIYTTRDRAELYESIEKVAIFSPEIEKNISSDLKAQLESMASNMSYKTKNLRNFYNADFLDELVRWCCEGGPETVDQFKQALDIDNILATAIKTMLSIIRLDEEYIEPKLLAYSSITPHGRVSPKALSALDEFFKWYFGKVEDAQEFKLRKALNFDDTQFLRDLNRTAEIDESEVRTMLAWLLGNDRQRMDEFKARLGGLNVTERVEHMDVTNEDEQKDDEGAKSSSYEALSNAI